MSARGGRSGAPFRLVAGQVPRGGARPPRRQPAARRRPGRAPRARPVARPRRPGHRQDDDAGRGGRRPGRGGHDARPHPHPDVLPAGGRRSCATASPLGSAAPSRRSPRGPSTPSPTPWRARPGRPRTPVGRCGCSPDPSRTSSCASCWPATVADGLREWPDELAVALGTRGFADEVRTLLARARGLRARAARPRALRRRGRRASRLACRGPLPRRVPRRPRPARRPRLRRAGPPRGRARRVRRRVVPRCAPATTSSSSTSTRTPTRRRSGCSRPSPVTVATWWSSATPTSRSTASAGAEVRGLLDFRDAVPDHDRAIRPRSPRLTRVPRGRAPTCSPPRASVARRMPLAGGGLADALRAHRALSAADDLPQGRVDVWTYPSPSAQLDAIADVLRRAHLDDGLPWAQMAVLVRSGVRSLPYLRRVLGAAGVPVEVGRRRAPAGSRTRRRPAPAGAAGGRRPGAADPGGGGGPAAEPARRPRGVRAAPTRPAAARRGAGGVPGGPPAAERRAGPRGTRRTGAPRRARRCRRRGGGASGRAAGARSRDGLRRWRLRLRRAVGAVGRHRVAAAARAGVLGGWSGRTARRPRPRRRGRAVRGGVAVRGAHRAPRRADLPRRARGPADPGRHAGRARGARRRGARAHRPPQQGPRVGPGGARRRPGGRLARPAPTRVAARRRAAHVRRPGPATVAGRAARRGAAAVLRRGHPRPLPPRGHGRRLPRGRRRPTEPVRRRARGAGDVGGRAPPSPADPDRPSWPSCGARPPTPTPTSTLATGGGRTPRRGSRRLAPTTACPSCPAAHPDRWWGIDELTDPQRPLHPDGAPIRLSGSSLSGLLDCPLRWFLDHEAKACVGAQHRARASGRWSTPSPTTSRRAPAPRRSSRSWCCSTGCGTHWRSRRGGSPTGSGSRPARLSSASWRWHTDDRGRTLVASEHPFTVSLAVGDREVVLRGLDGPGRGRPRRAGPRRRPQDRQDTHRAGRRSPSTRSSGVYQVAVREGAVADLPGLASAASGGAELVQLRSGDKDGRPKVQEQPPLVADDDGATDVDRHLAAAVRSMTAEEFPPTPGEACGWCQFKAACPARDEGRQVVR